MLIIPTANTVCMHSAYMMILHDEEILPLVHHGLHNNFSDLVCIVL